jgi:hypothetical protein
MAKTKESANCPFCLDPIEDKVNYILCPLCGVKHHADCWKTNGKCAVHGCDGSLAWSGAIGDKIAPKIKSSIDIETTERSAPAAVKETPLCIDCGKPVGPGQLVCRDCGRKRPAHCFENCSGPSILILGGIIAIFTLILKGLS